jgi:hypothetical protein
MKGGGKMQGQRLTGPVPEEGGLQLRHVQQDERQVQLDRLAKAAPNAEAGTARMYACFYKRLLARGRQHDNIPGTERPLRVLLNFQSVKSGPMSQIDSPQERVPSSTERWA